MIAEIALRPKVHDQQPDSPAQPLRCANPTQSRAQPRGQATLLAEHITYSGLSTPHSDQWVVEASKGTLVIRSAWTATSQPGAAVIKTSTLVDASATWSLL